MIDVRILQVLRVRKDYNAYRQFVPVVALDPHTKVLLDDYGAYFAKFKSDTIDYDTFVSWFEKFQHPKLKDEQRAVYRQIMRTALQGDMPEGVQDGLLDELRELRLAHQTANTIQRWNEGEIADLSASIAASMEAYKLDKGVSFDAWVQPDLEGFLQQEVDESGLRWPLLALEATTRPLRPGDALILAARPGRGKTSFLAFLLTHWARFTPSGTNIVWVNNEGPGARIYPRLYQAALRCGVRGLVDRNKAGTLHSDYAKAIGRADKIRVLDVHGMNMAQVDVLLEQHSPSIIVFDMLNNIKVQEAGTRTDLDVEARGQWARERGVKYDACVLSTWQLSAAAEGVLYPTMADLKDSKTGLQGACDGIVMLGYSNTPGMESVRGLSIVKTKMQREGAPADPRCEIMFHRDTCQFADLKPEEEEGSIEL
jgi:replicative DNA helicase